LNFFKSKGSGQTAGTAVHEIRGPNGDRVIIMGGGLIDKEALAMLPIMMARAMRDMQQMRSRLDRRMYAEEKVFGSMQARRDVAEVGIKMANYLRKNEVKSLVCVDRSARAGYMPVVKAWRMLYPDEARPEVYFINPSALGGMGWHDTERNFKMSYKYLLGNRKFPVAVLDTCIHTGRAVKSVVGSLKDVGFSDIHVCVPQLDEDATRIVKSLKAKPFSILDREPCMPCLTFGGYDMVEKQTYNIISEKRCDPEPTSRSLRIEIAEIFEKLEPIIRKEASKA
jgi:hypothetical protein